MTLAQASKKYLTFVELTKAKSRPTLAKETCALNGWMEDLGDQALRRITRDDLNTYALERTAEGVSNRTVNLDILALKHVLVFARDSGLLPSDKSLVTDNWKPLKHTTPRRELMSHSTLAKLVQECVVTFEGKFKRPRGQFLADYLLFLAFSGARKTAALTMKWSNVDWQNLQVTLFTKFDKYVVVDMNPKLETHLREMFVRRDVCSDYLFPDAGDPHKLFDEVRTAVGCPHVTLHDFRHYFASWAVMSGVSLLTVSNWLGHSDGGRLVSKVYSHLSNEYRKTEALKVSFNDGR